MKICTVCKITKPFSDFYNSKFYKSGYSYRCKECDTKAVNSYREKHGDRYRRKARNNQIKHVYGLTVHEINHVLKKQNFVCAICGEEPEPNKQHKGLVVDHDHNTGIFRGMLCHKCNQGLGLFKDSYHKLLKAARYLKTTNTEIH